MNRHLIALLIVLALSAACSKKDDMSHPGNSGSNSNQQTQNIEPDKDKDNTQEVPPPEPTKTPETANENRDLLIDKMVRAIELQFKDDPELAPLLPEVKRYFLSDALKNNFGALSGGDKFGMNLTGIVNDIASLMNTFKSCQATVFNEDFAYPGKMITAEEFDSHEPNDPFQYDGNRILTYIYGRHVDTYEVLLKTKKSKNPKDPEKHEYKSIKYYEVPKDLKPLVNTIHVKLIVRPSSECERIINSVMAGFSGNSDELIKKVVDFIEGITDGLGISLTPEEKDDSEVDPDKGPDSGSEGKNDEAPADKTEGSTDKGAADPYDDASSSKGSGPKPDTDDDNIYGDIYEEDDTGPLGL